MGKKILVLAVLLARVAMARGDLQGDCAQGGYPVLFPTLGFTSSTQVERSFPQCTVTIYITGTGTPGTLATIYSDNSGTPLSNPFTATVNGHWQFWADNGRYNVQFSGAGIPSTYTWFDFILSDGGGGGTTLPSGSQLQYLRIQPNTTSLTYQFAPVGFVYGLDYNFPAQTPGGSLTIGNNTITLAPVPLGVNGTDIGHYLYVSAGTGTAEACLITGGTAVAGSASGSLIINCANTHSGAWTIQSATTGIQEAVVTVGFYGGVYLGCGSYEIYAPIRISYRVSLQGCGQDVSFLHNNSATTGVINYTALTIAGDQNTFGGLTFNGFTIYAGTKANVAVDTSISDAIYILGAGWGVTVRDVMVRNHATGYHTVNTWSSHFDNANIRYFRDYGYYTETDATIGAGTENGLGAGGDQRIENSWISNVGATGVPTDTGCGVRYANWSGLYLHSVITTAAQYGLCLQPRALKGGETFTQVYYGMVDNCAFDTSVHDGLLVDTTNGTSGGVSEIDFVNIKSAYNGCLQTQANACNGVNFANAANGINLKATVPNVIRGLRFIGGVVRENGGHGVLTSNNAYVNTVKFLGMDADNNSQAANNTYDGYHISSNNFQITIEGVTSGSMNSVLTRHPRYGLFADAALTQMVVANNTFYPLNGTAPCAVNSLTALNNFNNNYPFTDQICNLTVYPPAQAFASLTPCSVFLQGKVNAIADSTSNTWGAIITGGGGFSVLGFCNGTNWTVAAK